MAKEGRPTLYKPEYCNKVREMLKKGYSKIEIAFELDVNRKTLDYWSEANPEFYRTINEDIDFSEGWWTKLGRENLTNKDFNSRLYEINMMNRFGWMKKSQGKQQIEVSCEVQEIKQIRDQYKKDV